MKDNGRPRILPPALTRADELLEARGQASLPEIPPHSLRTPSPLSLRDRRGFGLIDAATRPHRSGFFQPSGDLRPLDEPNSGERERRRALTDGDHQSWRGTDRIREESRDAPVERNWVAGVSIRLSDAVSTGIGKGSRVADRRRYAAAICGASSTRDPECPKLAVAV